MIGWLEDVRQGGVAYRGDMGRAAPHCLRPFGLLIIFIKKMESH